LLAYFQRPHISLVQLQLLFTALALGSKYSAVAPILIASILLLTKIILSAKTFFRKHFRLLLFTLIFSLALGGYWYLKNWFQTGNPIYPFFLPCAGCEAYNQSFFSWAIPLDLTHFPQIFHILVVGPNLVSYFVLFSLPLIFLLRYRSSRQIVLLLITLFALEYLLMSRLGGYEPRYFFHWNFIWAIIFAVGSYTLIKPIISVISSKTLIILSIPILLIAGFFASQKLVSTYRLYAPGGLNYLQTAYALGRADIHTWIKSIFPKTASVIFWCDQQTSPTHLYVQDPDLLWFTPEAQFHIFLTRCSHGGAPDLAQDSYIVSLQDCQQPDQLPLRNQYEVDDIYATRVQNQKIVCQSQEIIPNLYLYTPPE